jgi:hypothetical protein
MCIAIAFGDAFQENNATAMIIWLAVAIITFAIIFAINSSIHSFLVVNYVSAEKVAISVGFYYMSNACGRLFGTIGSGILSTYVGDYTGPLAGTDAVSGLAACFLAGTICSFVAVIITQIINDDKAGLQCGSCLTSERRRGGASITGTSTLIRNGETRIRIGRIRGSQRVPCIACFVICAASSLHGCIEMRIWTGNLGHRVWCFFLPCRAQRLAAQEVGQSYIVSPYLESSYVTIFVSLKATS